MRKSIENAMDAVADRTRALAADATTAETVKVLAESLSLLEHGPQGGRTDTDYFYRSETSDTTDYHYTTHDGRPQKRLGFADGS